MDNSDDEEHQFFDAPEHIDQESDSVSDCPFIKSWEYDVWISAPQSVRERRREFIKWMCALEGENPVNMCDNSKGDVFIRDSHRIIQNSDDPDFSEGLCRNVNVNFNGGGELNLENERLENIRVTGLDGGLSRHAVENVCQLSPSGQQFAKREVMVNTNTPRKVNKLKNGFLSKLRSMTRTMSKNVKYGKVGSNSFSQVEGKRVQRVRVRHCRRRFKELSALFTGQDIQAHEGTITAMKSSLDGQYLASAGEDKIVRVWQVVEDERSDTIDIPDSDPSYVYFSVNHLSELGPSMVEKYKIKKCKSLRRMRDSACIIFPQKVFRILEKPLHVFQGHNGEILDLSWSTNNCLLSSSVDKTVRLWRVGVDQCLRVFLHTDYVTCIQFNPVNDDYFISGSIDGKARIWAVDSCQVVDWNERRDMITAVSYRPDGQGGIIGYITGTCRFFEISDNHFHMGTQMCLTGKKKSPCKRITGFQFLPQDSSKVLVTCADSQVRIIDGTNVIGKYKGPRNCGNQISASFTSDGKHIISASEDSNVYVWNYNSHQHSSFSRPKAIKSFDCFSSNASMAIPWSGLKTSKLYESSITPSLPFSPLSSRFSTSQEFFSESSSKGSATWPEEKLPPVSSPRAFISPLMGKSRHKFFKSCCQSSYDSHAWGLVIVTAGWDGRIRSFHNYGLPKPL